MSLRSIVIEIPDLKTGFDIEDTLTANIKAQLKLRGMNYTDLSVALRALGYEQKPASIYSKLSRGGYSAKFLIACLAAAHATTIELRVPAQRQDGRHLPR
jgi:hypothetical protein